MKTPRVDRCIRHVMDAYPGASKAEQAKYYEEVHQRLGPLARKLEIENGELRRQLEALRPDIRKRRAA